MRRVERKTATREDLPEHDFLLPAQKKYPVTNPETGKLDRELLLAAERRATLQGRTDLARKAKRIREDHFGPTSGAKDRSLLSFAADGSVILEPLPTRRLGETRAAFARRQYISGPRSGYRAVHLIPGRSIFAGPAWVAATALAAAGPVPRPVRVVTVAGHYCPVF